MGRESNAQSVVEALGVRIKNDILHRGVSIGLAKMQNRWKGMLDDRGQRRAGMPTRRSLKAV
jgi:hypothetical protein